MLDFCLRMVHKKNAARFLAGFPDGEMKGFSEREYTPAVRLAQAPFISDMLPTVSGSRESLIVPALLSPGVAWSGFGPCGNRKAQLALGVWSTIRIPDKAARKRASRLDWGAL